jgi:Fe-S cluster assembly ATP-binding protein
MSQLVIEGLHVEIGSREVLRGFDLTMSSGEVHVIMGPNGSGKSTLAHALTGHPGYRITGGHASIDGVNLLELTPSERVHAGLFLALQHPLDVPGVRLVDALVSAGATGEDVRERMRVEAERLGLRDELLDRFINVDLSGGERKRAEMVQFGRLPPHFAVLDHIDAGRDDDAHGAAPRRPTHATTEWNCGVLAITHFRRLLQELTPDVIHVVSAGRVVATGGAELSEQLEAEGYEPFTALGR